MNVEGISDLRIVGIDEKRPPKIRKEPYIDIIFKLSHKAPADWCRELNALLANHPSKPKIKDSEGLYIESWVRKPDDIPALFDLLKKKIAQCNQQYIERIQLSLQNADDANASLVDEGGEQGRLNRIIASLDFGDAEAEIQ